MHFPFTPKLEVHGETTVLRIEYLITNTFEKAPAIFWRSRNISERLGLGPGRTAPSRHNPSARGAPKLPLAAGSGVKGKKGGHSLPTAGWVGVADRRDPADLE